MLTLCVLLCQVAARTLGDLVRKLGERVLPEIIPILEHGLDSEQSDQRQGVCIGLREIMTSTQRDHVSTVNNWGKVISNISITFGSTFFLLYFIIILNLKLTKLFPWILKIV